MKNQEATIRKQVRKILKEMAPESGWYPPGAEFDPNAPWNDKSQDVYIDEYQFNPQTSEFTVWTTNGNEFKVDAIDVLEKFWKKNPGTHGIHERLFGEDDQTFDAKVVQYLEKQKPKVFTDILYEIAEYRGLLASN